MFTFLWNGKVEKLKNKILYSPKYEEPLGITNLAIHDMVLKITWVKRSLNNAELKLNIIDNKQLGYIGHLFGKCNFKKEDVKEGENI